MVPRGPEQVEDGGAHGERPAEGVDEFAGIPADDLGAEDAPAFGLRENLHVAIVGLHEDRLAVVVERIAGAPIGLAGGVELAFQPANRRKLRVRKNDAEEQGAVERLERLEPGGMARGKFALLDGQMDDLVGAGAVAAGIDVGRAGLLPAVDDDLAVGPGADPGGAEIEPGRVGLAPQRIEEVRGAAGASLASLEKSDRGALLRLGDALNLGAREALDALVLESLPDHGGSLRGVIAQEVGAALDERHPRADAPEKLGEFAGDNPAAEHEDAPGHESEVEDLVAGPGGGGGEPGHRGDADLGAGADQHMPGAQHLAVGELERVGVPKAGIRPDQIEFGVGERLLPVGGKLADQLDLAGVDRAHVGPGGGNLQTELFPLLRPMEHLGGVEEGLGRHATPQDAQAAEVAGAVDDGGLQAEPGGDAGGVKPGAAAAQHKKIVGLHEFESGEGGSAGQRVLRHCSTRHSTKR